MKIFIFYLSSSEECSAGITSDGSVVFSSFISPEITHAALGAHVVSDLKNILFILILS